MWKQMLIMRSIKITAIHSVAWMEKFWLFGNWINRWTLQGSYSILRRQLWRPVSTYKHKIKPRSCNHRCCGKAISIIYSECVSVILVIQLAKRMRLSPVARLALQYFSILSHKSTIFGKKLLNIKRVFWCPLQLLSESFFILKKFSEDIVKWSDVSYGAALGDESTMYIRVIQ